eukprot:1223671-Prymnesium_polylepis.1
MPARTGARLQAVRTLSRAAAPGCPHARLQRGGMLSALRSAPARLVGPQAPRSAPCPLDAHGCVCVTRLTWGRCR